MSEGQKRVVVIGSGPAGLTAALYTARAQLPTTVITGPLLGGQIATTHEVENFPGFPDGTTGPELVEAMRAQAERFGTHFVYDSVARAQLLEGPPFRIETAGGATHEADAVIVTIGANPRALGIPGEAEYVGHGVSYCATCDGFFFRGKDVVVVGGGDSALQEALFLTRFATRVDIIHRRDELRASVALQSRAFAHEKIHFIWDTVVDEIRANGKGAVNAILTRNVRSDEQETRAVDGVFIFIGYDPNSDVFAGQLATDDAGYVLIDQRYRSNIEGVFAAGEIHDQIFRQAITAAGDGCAAALTAIEWLDSD